MGWALAEAARDAGAQVTLVAGPTGLANLKRVTTVPVTSAREMCAATCLAARKAHLVISAAAVADWRPLKVFQRKLKKGKTLLVLRFTPNPDILRTLAENRRGPFPRLAGFALETNNLLANARRKLREKKLDLIVANSPETLGNTKTRAWILQPGRAPTPFSGDKKKLARRILARLLETMPPHDRPPE